MIRHRQALVLAIALFAAGVSSAQAADCSGSRADYTTFDDAAAAADREVARYEKIVPAPGYDDALCHALKHEAATLITLQGSTKAECLADPSTFQDTVDEIADMLKHVGNMEALACAPGQ